MRFCVIPCGKAKIWDRRPDVGPTAAREVYRGGLSAAARLYAEQFYADRWVILSAKHGFLRPDDLVAGTYDVTFGRKGDPVVSDDELRRQAALFFSSASAVDVVAPKAYADRVQAALAQRGIDIRVPLEQ